MALNCQCMMCVCVCAGRESGATDLPAVVFPSNASYESKPAKLGGKIKCSIDVTQITTGSILHRCGGVGGIQLCCG
jgi:hypothetical protein